MRERGREERCGRQEHVTEDVALWPRGRMVKNSANGREDCLLTEMLQVLPMESVKYGFCYPVSRSFTMCHPLTL